MTFGKHIGIGIIVTGKIIIASAADKRIVAGTAVKIIIAHAPN